MHSGSGNSRFQSVMIGRRRLEEGSDRPVDVFGACKRTGSKRSATACSPSSSPSWVPELKVPRSVYIAALTPLLPVFLSYLLSLVYVGIYWNNHHHLFHLTKNVSSGVLWANLHLLFWLSFVPFMSGWLGENHVTSTPTAVYGFVLLMAAIAYIVFATRYHQSARPELPSRICDWRRLERQALPGSRFHRYPSRVRKPLGLHRLVCVRPVDLAHT
jgi:hypothetical protein